MHRSVAEVDASHVPSADSDQDHGCGLHRETFVPTSERATNRQMCHEAICARVKLTFPIVTMNIVVGPVASLGPVFSLPSLSDQAIGAEPRALR